MYIFSDHYKLSKQFLLKNSDSSFNKKIICVGFRKQKKILTMKNVNVLTTSDFAMGVPISSGLNCIYATVPSQEQHNSSVQLWALEGKNEHCSDQASWNSF